MPQWTSIVEQTELTGTRIDAYLSKAGPLSRSAIERLIKDNRVFIGGKIARKNYKVQQGDVITVNQPDPIPDIALPENIPLDILYEDADLIVLDKPRGMVCHPAPGHESGTLVNALLFHCGEELSGIGGVKRPGIVHRLDMDTSGLMLVAKTDMAHVAISAALKRREVTRIYHALARGNIAQDAFAVSAPLGRHPADRKRMAVTPSGRSAATHFRVLERYKGYTRLECRLETGRTHQIRVHLSSIGHPLAGDSKYGGNLGELGLDSQCLHSTNIGFTHPRLGESMYFHSDLPKYFQKAIANAQNL